MIRRTFESITAEPTKDTWLIEQGRVVEVRCNESHAAHVLNLTIEETHELSQALIALLQRGVKDG